MKTKEATIHICECDQYPGMHDEDNVCVHWEMHDGLPCDEQHTTIFRMLPSGEEPLVLFKHAS
jgi:hypothetical protein